MSDILDTYLEGIQKVPKGKKISSYSVCKAIGKDAASLKRDRIDKYPWIETVLDAIDIAEEKRQETGNTSANPIAYEKGMKQKYKAERDEYKRLLNDAYAREVALIYRLDELERALEIHECDKPLKLLKPRK